MSGYGATIERRGIDPGAFSGWVRPPWTLLSTRSEVATRSCSIRESSIVCFRFVPRRRRQSLGAATPVSLIKSGSQDNSLPCYRVVNETEQQALLGVLWDPVSIPKPSSMAVAKRVAYLIPFRHPEYRPRWSVQREEVTSRFHVLLCELFSGLLDIL